MRVAARASAWTPMVHAVEDAGAICGARPRNGEWRLSMLVPVNCPRCMLGLTTPRLAVCESMAMPRRMHIRWIDEHGLKPREGIKNRTLCGAIPLVDVRILVGMPPDDACARCLHVLATRGPAV